ncbi:MAG TPA: c-type cytochrome [Usitatibacter sp.]|nr:c-type cytochrome [Usitatibacter sp.]
MSDSHRHAAADPHTESNPVKLAIMITLGAVAVVIAIIMLVQLAVGSYGSREMKSDPSMSDKAVASRIAPVAKVEVDPNAPAKAPAQAAPAAPATAAAIPPAAPTQAAAAAGGSGAGKSTYDTACVACHGAGIAGAPKFGDKAAWAPRIAQGAAALHASALKGKGAMPPKGGNTALADDAVKAAVDYMVAAAK